jgi:hypothetical protein
MKRAASLVLASGALQRDMALDHFHDIKAAKQLVNK